MYCNWNHRFVCTWNVSSNNISIQGDFYQCQLDFGTFQNKISSLKWILVLVWVYIFIICYASFSNTNQRNILMRHLFFSVSFQTIEKIKRFCTWIYWSLTIMTERLVDWLRIKGSSENTQWDGSIVNTMHMYLKKEKELLEQLRRCKLYELYCI